MPIVTGPGISSFSLLQKTAVFPLVAGATILIPTGRMVICIYSGDGDFTDVRFEIQGTAGWEPARDRGGVWAPSAGSFVFLFQMTISDGVNYRFHNTGVGDIADLEYYYMVL